MLNKGKPKFLDDNRVYLFEVFLFLISNEEKLRFQVNLHETFVVTEFNGVMDDITLFGFKCIRKESY